MKEIPNKPRKDVDLRRSTRHRIASARTETQPSQVLTDHTQISRALSQMALSDYQPFSREGTSTQDTPQSDGDTTSEIQNTTRLEFQFQNLTPDIVGNIIHNNTLKSIRSIILKSSISIIDCSMARRKENETETVSKERLLNSLKIIMETVKNWRGWSDIRKETNEGQELKEILDHFDKQDKLYDEKRNRHMNTSEVTDREHTLEPMSEVNTTTGNTPEPMSEVHPTTESNTKELSPALRTRFSDAQDQSPVPDNSAVSALDYNSFSITLNNIITRASNTLYSSTNKSDINKEDRLKCVELLRKARDDRSETGYEYYLQVLKYAENDNSIRYAVKSIYQASNNIALDYDSFCNINNNFITKASNALYRAIGKSDINKEDRLKCVELLRKARDDRSETGYEYYLQVLKYAKNDNRIRCVVKFIHSNIRSEFDINSITLDYNSFSNIGYGIISKAAKKIYKLTTTSNTNKENRLKSVTFLRKARDNRSETSYRYYQRVLEFAKDDDTIRHAVESIYKASQTSPEP